MKETYQYCRKCHLLSPLPIYFYDDLDPNWKSLCIWCVEKLKKMLEEEPKKEEK